MDVSTRTYMHIPIFLYVYMCAKVYEDCYVYNVCRVVHIFLYMLNFSSSPSFYIFDGNLFRPGEAYMRQ